MLQKVENYDLEELVNFVYSIYKYTEGKYPFLEWMENKPDKNDYEKFKKVYKSFLKKRVEEEFDEFYLWKNEKIISTFALVYEFKNKNIEWIPPFLTEKNSGFIEFFMVSPEYQGKGYGKITLHNAIERLNELGKEKYIVTSLKINAYSFYKKFGFKDFCTYKQFLIVKYGND
ncbi:MAG TPA: N-acetyltransferase [Thermoplasmatales archaeon]|nr:N-acetyltransferase [Thermoplasmatales archaeon]